MRTRSALGCFLMLSLAPCVSDAAPFTFGLTGHVTSIIDPAGILVGSGFTPSIDDVISGSYTFDTATAGGSLGTNIMSYTVFGSPYGMQFEIAGTAFATDPAGFMTINVFDDADLGSGPQDRYVVFTGAGPVGGLDVSQVIFEGATFTNLGTITSTNLPLIPPDFSQFDFLNEFTVALHVGGDFAFVVGTIDHLDPGDEVPEPGTTALLALAIGGLVLRQRRGSRIS